MATIGIPAHELGHSFGLPDLYGDNNRVGSLSIMGNGAWNSLPGKSMELRQIIWMLGPR